MHEPSLSPLIQTDTHTHTRYQHTLFHPLVTYKLDKPILSKPLLSRDKESYLQPPFRMWESRKFQSSMSRYTYLPGITLVLRIHYPTALLGIICIDHVYPISILKKDTRWTHHTSCDPLFFEFDAGYWNPKTIFYQIHTQSVREPRF